MSKVILVYPIQLADPPGEDLAGSSSRIALRKTDAPLWAVYGEKGLALIHPRIQTDGGTTKMAYHNETVRAWAFEPTAWSDELVPVSGQVLRDLAALQIARAARKVIGVEWSKADYEASIAKAIIRVRGTNLFFFNP